MLFKLQEIDPARRALVVQMENYLDLLESFTERDTLSANSQELRAVENAIAARLSGLGDTP
jgi:hypothetical protein